MSDAFIRANTLLATAPLVPEIRLHLATELTPIWQASEDSMQRIGLEPPFWAFAWPGSQALARYVLDDPSRVAGRRVLDFAAGSGLAAIACARAGAQVTACEIDPLAVAAIRLNATENGVAIEVIEADLVGARCVWDLILCGDVCYAAPMAGHVLPWLRRMAGEAEVWMADPGRAYAPGTGLAELWRVAVPTSLELEDRLFRTVVLSRIEPAIGGG